MLTKTSLIMFIIFLGHLGYIVMSDSEKKSKYSFFEKKSDSAFFCRENYNFGGRGHSVIFSRFLYIYIF